MKQQEIPYPLYGLIPSQQTMYMMVRYSFHKQLVQVPTSFSVDKDIEIVGLELTPFSAVC